MAAALKPDQIDTLIRIIHNVANCVEFTLSGHSDLEKTWKKAADVLTPVCDLYTLS